MLLSYTGFASGRRPQEQDSLTVQLTYACTAEHTIFVAAIVFLLWKLRYIVDIDSRKLFFSTHIKPHTDYALAVWVGCSDVLQNRVIICTEEL